MFRNQKVRPNDARHFVFEGGVPPQRDQLGRLALVEPAGDPVRLFALGALAVKQIHRLIELQQHPPKRFQLRGQPAPKRERGRGDAPLVPGEEAPRWHPSADEARLLGGGNLCRGNTHNEWSGGLRLAPHVRTCPLPKPSHL